MTPNDIRDKYIKFFTSSPRNHIEIAPSPLVLENDPTTLFTSAGMQPLVPYLMGEEHPQGKRLVDAQPSIRTNDIDEVGDLSHLTFFKMLGNWSLGDYFKDEQLAWVFEFFTKELKLPKEKLWVSVFEGNKVVPKDEESAEIWKKLGISESRILYYGVNENWWSRSGTPDAMPIGEIGGPDSEVFYDFGEKLKLHEKSSFKNEKCHPNCQCGRFMEIGNSVFMQYKKIGEGVLEELPQKNVDFGGGLERIAAAVNGDPDVFKTDLFYPTIQMMADRIGISHEGSEELGKSFRIIADHMRASIFLIKDGVRPGNKLQDYVLRRLLRRSALKAFLIEKDLLDRKFSRELVKSLAKPYGRYLINKDISEIEEVVSVEIGKFRATIENGLRVLNKTKYMNGRIAFDIYQTYGFPLELIIEEWNNRGYPIKDQDRKEFEEEFEKHKEKSRSTSAGVFRGGLADHSPEVVRLHTATHLLLASLRNVLGEHVVQKGQNITKERSRFDFPNPGKLTEVEFKKVEELINEVIKKDLPVNFEVMPKVEAEKTGAIHAFNEKYADTVKVYFVGKGIDSAFSKEFCGGPHVSHTGEIGRVKITKQEKIGSGLIRIYMELT